jgi:multidrug efflux pump subunit AcrB
MIAPIHGVTLPSPAGGKYRQIMVDIDQTKLLAKGLTPLQVVSAVNAQNLTLPGGWEKIGKTQYTVRTNSMPPTIEAPGIFGVRGKARAAIDPDRERLRKMLEDQWDRYTGGSDTEARRLLMSMVETGDLILAVLTPRYLATWGL